MSPTLGDAGGRYYASGSNNSGDNLSDRQFVVLASEKQARVVALPSQNCIYRTQLADTDFVVKAETISIKGSLYYFFAIYFCNVFIITLELSAFVNIITLNI